MMPEPNGAGSVRHQGGHYLCLGIGVGPANLSLPSLLHGRAGLANLFIDRKGGFDWHEGQLMSGATLQVSVLKDLVTLSEPTNEFSFLSYLHCEGKLYSFMNARFDEVPRQEFSKYLNWAGERNENISLGEEALSVEFDGVFKVQTSKRFVTADNIVVGVGTRPWLPAAAEQDDCATSFHISEFKYKAIDLAGKRVCVVGGGQSGAEAFLELISRSDSSLPSQASWISRRRNFFPIDDSPFTNDFFTPSYADYFYELDYDTREIVNSRHVLTSDGISESTLRQIYQRVYFHRFSNDSGSVVGLYPNREVLRSCQNPGGGWQIVVDHKDHADATEVFDADVLIWATGFQPSETKFLAPIEPRLERENKEYRVDENFAARWDGPADRNVFFQNAVRQQRGLADPNLSLNAWRSMRILDRIRGVSNNEGDSSLIDWSPVAAEPRRDAVTDAT